MKFLGQGFQKLRSPNRQSVTDRQRQTRATENITTPHSWALNKQHEKIDKRQKPITESIHRPHPIGYRQHLDEAQSRKERRTTRPSNFRISHTRHSASELADSIRGGTRHGLGELTSPPQTVT